MGGSSEAHVATDSKRAGRIITPSGAFWFPSLLGEGERISQGNGGNRDHIGRLIVRRGGAIRSFGETHRIEEKREHNSAEFSRSLEIIPGERLACGT